MSSYLNPELINLYKTIQTEVQELINDLQKHKNSAEYFQEIRKADREENYKYLNKRNMVFYADGI